MRRRLVYSITTLTERGSQWWWAYRVRKSWAMRDVLFFEAPLDPDHIARCGQMAYPYLWMGEDRKPWKMPKYQVWRIALRKDGRIRR